MGVRRVFPEGCLSWDAVSQLSAWRIAVQDTGQTGVQHVVVQCRDSGIRKNRSLMSGHERILWEYADGSDLEFPHRPVLTFLFHIFQERSVERVGTDRGTVTDDI